MWLLLAAVVGLVPTLILPLLLLPPYIACVVFIIVMNITPPRSEYLRKIGLGRVIRNAVRYKMEKAFESVPEFDENGQYIFASHPHAFLSFSEMLTFVFDNPDTLLKTLAVKTVPLVASELLYLPILGHLVHAIGCESIAKKNFKKLLGEGKSISLTPGGVREVKFAARCSHSHITLRKSVGFLKLAKEKNVHVVPMLTIGESNCYKFYPTISWLQDLCIALIGYPMPVLAVGRFYTFWPLKDSNITVVVGAPLDPAKYNSWNELATRYYQDLDQIATLRGITLRYVDRYGKALDDAKLSKDTDKTDSISN